jgi:circadian clock protein KaiC
MESIKAGSKHHENEKPKLVKTPTGIAGLDVMLGGGLPERRTISIIGGPGSGKTILCAQFLHNGIVQNNDRGVYISLDYSRDMFMQDMLQFDWDFDKWEKMGAFVFLEASSIRRIPHTQNVQGTLYSSDELTLEDLIDLITLYVDKIGAKRIVIDDLSALIFRFPDQVQRRSAVLNLIESLSALNVTTLMISEVAQYDFNRQINTEEYLADGVISMFMLKDGSRAIQISKMRGVAIDNKPKPYGIVEKSGIEVFPNETVFMPS